MEDLAAFSAREVKRAAAEEYSSVKVEVKSKFILTSFLKIEVRGTFVGAENWRERQLVELLGDQSQSPKVPSLSKRGGRK